MKENTLLAGKKTGVVGSWDGHLYAFNPATGAELWKTSLGGEVLVCADGPGNDVLAAGADGVLYAVDASTGEAARRFSCGDAVVAAPALAGETILVGSRDWHLYALTARGESRWKFKSTGMIESSPAAAGPQPSTISYLYLPAPNAISPSHSPTDRPSHRRQAASASPPWQLTPATESRLSSARQTRNACLSDSQPDRSLAQSSICDTYCSRRFPWGSYNGRRPTDAA